MLRNHFYSIVLALIIAAVRLRRRRLQRRTPSSTQRLHALPPTALPRRRRPSRRSPPPAPPTPQPSSTRSPSAASASIRRASPSTTAMPPASCSQPRPVAGRRRTRRADHRPPQQSRALGRAGSPRRPRPAVARRRKRRARRSCRDLEVPRRGSAAGARDRAQAGKGRSDPRDDADRPRLDPSRGAEIVRARTHRRRSTFCACKASQPALTALRALPADATPGAKAAAERAIRSVEHTLAMWGQVQNLWYGLSLGSVLLLAAIGLAITFGVMGVINMAHGEMVMLGAYTTFVVQEVIRTSAPGLFGWSLAIAIPLAFLVAGAVGVAHRARHHPLPLWPPARDAARDLGRQPRAAAGRAHRVRPDQPRGRHARLHDRRVRARRPHHHAEPPLHHQCSRG